MKALILAGGLGTRLSGVIKDIPKPLAPIAGKPFLYYLIRQLSVHGFEDIVLSTGHLGEKIVEAFGDGQNLGVHIDYSKEDKPAGTGGAIKLAAPLLEGGGFFVLNGDSFLDVDLSELAEMHHNRAALITMALARVDDTSRYGCVSIEESERVTRFEEKGAVVGAGLINAGIYVLDQQIFEVIPDEPRPVSLEREVFPRLLGESFYGHAVEGFFWDIGVPDDYATLSARPEPLFEALSR